MNFFWKNKIVHFGVNNPKFRKSNATILQMAHLCIFLGFCLRFTSKPYFLEASTIWPFFDPISCDNDAHY